MTHSIEDKKWRPDCCERCRYAPTEPAVHNCPCHAPQKNIEGWEEDIKKVARPSATTHSGLEVVYDPNALISQIHQLLKQERERVERVIDGMDEQNQVTQAILGALEYRGFYEAGKYIDDTLWERIKPILKAKLKNE